MTTSKTNSIGSFFIEGLDVYKVTKETKKMFYAEQLTEYGNKTERFHKKGIELLDELETLTEENAHKASTIANKSSMEWGASTFQFNTEPLGNGKFASSWGAGSNSKVVFTDDFCEWVIVSYK